MRHRLLIALVTLTFTSACVTNPARQISITDEEVQVREELDGQEEAARKSGKPDRSLSPFIRGTEPLDEQEFYDAIGDADSANQIRSSRGTGVALQGLGLGTMILGIAAAIAGAGLFLFSNSEIAMPPVFTIPEGSREYVLYGTFGSVAVAALGGALFFGMQGKARGDKKQFDLVHARRRMEISLYGENGATPDDIKSLSFGRGNEGAGVCAGQSLALGPVVALDARGRAMKVTDRAGWFQWLTTPTPGLVTQVPDAPVLSSSLTTGFANVNDPITVKLEIPETHVSAAMSFGHDFGCEFQVERRGTSGRDGERGRSGTSGKHGGSSSGPGDGVDGRDGGDGNPGGAGPSVSAELAWVRTEKYGRLALLVVGDEVQLFDPTKTKVRVLARGGSGGDGGSGGSGGSGGGAWSGTCSAGGDGGRGGRGGRGGVGGPGGRVKLRAADDALLDAVTLLAPGGHAGAAGAPGSGGGKGSSGSCKKGFPREGNRGTDGGRGASGTSGGEGSVDSTVVPVAELRGIAAVLAQNPTLTLEAEGAPAVKTRTKRR